MVANLVLVTETCNIETLHGQKCGARTHKTMPGANICWVHYKVLEDSTRALRTFGTGLILSNPHVIRPPALPPAGR
jgi:hypothetical protein